MTLLLAALASADGPALTGTILDDAADLPFPGLEVRIIGEDGASVSAVTDEEGRFSVADLAPGRWTVTAAAPGHLPMSVVVEVKAGDGVAVSLRLVAGDRAGEVLEVVAQRRITSDITERTLSGEQVRYLPGTGGDVVKAVQNLPGVARAPLGIGQLIIRGTAPEDSAYFLDGSSIPVVFHFSGLSTVINGDLVAEVAYLPGNYGARYGRALGGLVDLRTKDDVPERSRGYVSVDLFQGTAYVEQKAGPDTAVELSVRRSWIDAVLTPVLSGAGSTVRAPRYWDAQARALHRLPGGGLVDGLIVFSADRFSVVGGEDEGVAIGLSTTFGKARGRWLQPLGGEWKSALSAIGGPEESAFAFDGDPDAAFERSVAFGIREEISRDLGAKPGWRFGIDVSGGRDSFQYDVEAFSPYEAGDAWLLTPALYAEPSFRFGPAVLTPGLRLDAHATDFGYLRASVDPRLSSKIAAGADTVFTASVGRYSQFPTTRQLLPEADGNDALTEAWSLQSSVGIRRALPLSLSLEASAFYNRLYDLVEGREDRFRFFTGPPPIGPFDTDAYGNAGTGRVCGVEMLLKLDLPNTLALVSATLSSSTRTGRDGEPDLFEYDQPYVINALASQQLPRRWRVGVRGRVSAGDPYTPVVNRVYDMEARGFVPIYGDRDGARLPPAWSVDVRVDKSWPFRTWELTAYLDVQNALNAQNPEVMAWTYDYAAEDPIAGLPIIPAFGLRGEW